MSKNYRVIPGYICSVDSALSYVQKKIPTFSYADLEELRARGKVKITGTRPRYYCQSDLDDCLSEYFGTVKNPPITTDVLAHLKYTVDAGFMTPANAYNHLVETYL